METIYRKVKLTEKIPEQNDFLKCDDCSIVFIYKDGIKEFWTFTDFENIQYSNKTELMEYWLEEIKLPSGAEILKTAKEDAREMWGNLHDTFIPGSVRTVGESNEISFITGCDYIMNQIIL